MANYNFFRPTISKVRISFLSTHAIAAHVHFKDRFFKCTKRICCEALGPAKVRGAAPVIVYDQVPSDIHVNNVPVQVQPWVFSRNVHVQIKDMEDNFENLENNYSLVVWSEPVGGTEFKQTYISPFKKSTDWRKSPDQSKILAQVRVIKKNLPHLLAVDLTEAEIEKLLLKTEPSPQVISEPKPELSLISLPRRVVWE